MKIMPPVLIGCLRHFIRRVSLDSRGFLLLEERISRNDERATNQPQILQKIRFSVPRLQIPTSHSILNVDDISARLKRKNNHRARTGFQLPVPETVKQDYYSLSELLEVSLAKVAPTAEERGEEEMPYICDPPPLKLPGWLRDRRLPRSAPNATSKAYHPWAGAKIEDSFCSSEWFVSYEIGFFFRQSWT